jgi:hypothetical protein
MSNTDTDFIILDENPVYANQISEFIQCLNLSCLRFQRPQLYIVHTCFIQNNLLDYLLFILLLFNITTIPFVENTYISQCPVVVV